MLWQNIADSAVLGFFSKVYAVAVFCLKLRPAR
jgi:hypothetical protein